MAFLLNNVNMYLSGGAANANPQLSYGGAISSVPVTNDTLNNLFDTISVAENTAGLTDYRCVYLKNDNDAGEMLMSCVLYLQSITDDDNVTITFGLGGAVNDQAETLVDETTAPTGVTFVDPQQDTTEITVPDMDGGEYIALWVKREIAPGATASPTITIVVRIEGLEDIVTGHRYWRINMLASNGNPTKAAVDNTYFGNAETANLMSALGGTAAADSTSLGTAADAFFGGGGSYGWASADTAFPHWVTWDFGEGNEPTVTSVTVSCSSIVTLRDEMIANWELQYSDDGVNWTTQAEVADGAIFAASETRTYDVTPGA